MENRKFVKILAVVFLVFGIVSQTFAYSVETHAFLTAEAVKFYNANFSEKPVTAELGNFAIDGARREDDIPRWMNHFYDPVYNRGLTDNILGTWQKSRDWAQDPANQNKPTYKVPTLIASVLTAVQQKNIEALSLATDFTWQKAIDFYVKGDTEKALFTLGHVLHLIEDAAVPEHTRNDPHPGDSPYEDYTSRFTLENPDNDLVKRLSGKDTFVFRDLNSYFDKLAEYTNSHFYSKDTIGIQSGYNLPSSIDRRFNEKNEIWFLFSNDNEFGDYHLVQEIKPSRFNYLVSNSNNFSLIDVDNLVREDYWRILSTKAVQYASGVINLFFEQAEKAKQEYELNKKQENDQLKASFIEVIREKAFDVVHEWNQAARVAASETPLIMYALPNQDNELVVATELAVEEPAIEEVIEETEDLSVEESAILENQINAAMAQVAGIRGTIDLLSEIRQENARSEAAAQASESFANSANDSPSSSGRSSSFSGGSSSNNPTAIIENSPATSTEDNSGATSTPEAEPEPEPEPEPEIPNQAPVAVFSFAPADPALGDTVEFDASSSTDADGQIISYSWNFGESGESSATSVLVSYDYSTTGTFAAVLMTTDDDGATSTATANIVIAAPRVPIADHIVISEILFDAEGSDNKKEFIELYNPTDTAIDLEDWELRYERANGNDFRLALFNHNDDQTVISSEGFLLVGLNNYDEDNFGGRIADIKRGNDLLNGQRNGDPEIIRVFLLNADEEEVENMSYDENSITTEGQSLERLAWQSGYCVISQDENEFLGHGCDRDNNEEDWRIRNEPNPQNSGNLPEPRRAPSVVNAFSTVFRAEPRPELVFSWDWSVDYNNATGTLSYEIRELDYGSSTPISLNSTATGTNQFVTEIGRDYHFSIRAVDAEGFGSATTTAQVSAPSFASAINFFRNPTATSSAYVELFYEDYPFIPQYHSYNGRPWSVTAFYLNREASGVDLGHDNWTNAGEGALTFDYQACGVSFSGPVIIWPEDSGRCAYEWGAPRRSALNWNSYLNEDNHLLMGTNANNPAFQAGDYLTVAFYSYAGDNSQALIAVDKTHYAFQEETPAHQPPVFAAGDLSFDFDESVSRLTISAPVASDPDTLAGAIVYELRIATSSEAIASTSPINAGNGYSFYAAAGYDYFFNLRAKDDFSNYADQELSGQWSYPVGEVVLDQGQSGDWSGGWGGVPNNCNYGMNPCYDSRSFQSLAFATDTVFQVANAILARGGGNDAAAIVLDVHPDSGNNPDVGIVLTSARIGNFNSAATEVSFVFDEPVNLAADQRYWLSLRVAEYAGDGNSRFHFNSFVNSLAAGGGAIADGNAAFREASTDLRINHQADKDWFLKLFR